jgi:bacteriorhodopsin
MPNDGPKEIKWGYYAISGVFYLYILFTLLISCRRVAIARNAKVGKLFTVISLYTIVIWTLYPVVWGLGDETRHLTVDVEIILFAVVWFSY